MFWFHENFSAVNLLLRDLPFLDLMLLSRRWDHRLFVFHGTIMVVFHHNNGCFSRHNNGCRWRKRSLFLEQTKVWGWASPEGLARLLSRGTTRVFSSRGSLLGALLTRLASGSTTRSSPSTLSHVSTSTTTRQLPSWRRPAARSRWWLS